MTFVEKEEEGCFKLGPGEGQEIAWFTIDEIMLIKLTPGTQILFFKYRELIEEMMRQRAVPSAKDLDLVPKKIDAVN